jgi:hypothetical protein
LSLLLKESSLKYTQFCFTERYFIVVFKGLLEVSQSLRVENEEFMKRYSDATAKVQQLEEDIVSVTHKAIEKETDLDRYPWYFKEITSVINKAT